MSALFKFSIFLVLALAVSIGIYLYASSLSEGDVTSAPPTQEAPIANVAPIAPSAKAPVAPAAKVDVDGDLADYMTARERRSLDGWRAFLAAHGSGFHAQLARAEIEKLLHAEKTPEPAPAEVSNGGSPDAKTTIEAAPPAGRDVTSSTPDEICKRDEERLERLRSNPSSDEAARFANDLRCEKLRPQLLNLMETLGPPPTAPAAAEVSDGVAPDAKTTVEAAPSAGSDVASSTPDEICNRDEDRLERLRMSPSSEEAARFANELRCEKLRPQLSNLMGSLASLASAPRAAEVSNGVAPDAKPTVEAALPAAPSAGSDVASSTPDEICKRDEDRLERLRMSPSSEEAARFADELRCEKLRPQLLRLMESLGFAPASAAQSPSGKGKLARGLKAASDCVSEQDKLDRIRAQPSADSARQFWRDLQCERLRPQVRLLLESLDIAAGPTAACQGEAEELSRIRTNPNRREAESFAREMTCDALKPQAERLLESLAE
ncbi:hypothetical protein [Roseiarcus sp.]|uniref:hypothetical protein n=1 Tax=Roseiarcus sp. TaxID=1969460 RepID=UPI003F9794BD